MRKYTDAYAFLYKQTHDVTQKLTILWFIYDGALTINNVTFTTEIMHKR